MFAWAKSKGMEWGTIDTLPEIIGLALQTDGHVGYYVGNGYAVEWRGFNYSIHFSLYTSVTRMNSPESRVKVPLCKNF